MLITQTDIYKFSIPMHPFTIATGTMDTAQNIFIRVHTDAGFYGVGECSAFPMIAGETQATCFELAKDFAALWKGKDATRPEDRMNELHAAIAFNATIKSAFDMALYDLAAKKADQPLYQFLGGSNKKKLETDITVGIGTPQTMAPEILFPQMDESLVYDSRADIWSIGVVYYQLLFGEPPYTGNNLPEMFKSMIA